MTLVIRRVSVAEGGFTGAGAPPTSQDARRGAFDGVAAMNLFPELKPTDLLEAVYIEMISEPL